MHILYPMMLSCTKATALILNKTHTPLSFVKNMQLELHVALCPACRNYMKQTKHIHELINTKSTPVPLPRKPVEVEVEA